MVSFSKKNENWDPLKNNLRVINNNGGIFHENCRKIFIFLLDLLFYGNFWSCIFCQNVIHNHKTLLHFILLYLMVTVYWFLIEWEANENWSSIIDDIISTLFQEKVNYIWNRTWKMSQLSLCSMLPKSISFVIGVRN